MANELKNMLIRRGLLNRKGQVGLLETLFIFIVLILLFGGIFNIWIWGNKQIVERQMRYNDSRVAAGTSDKNYELQWPMKRAEELKEESVLLNPP